MLDNFKPAGRKPAKNRARIRPNLSSAGSQPHPVELKVAVDKSNPEPLTFVTAAITAPKKKKFNFSLGDMKDFFRNLSRKQWIILGVVAVIVIGGGTAAALVLIKPKTKPAPVVKKEEKKPEPPKPTTESSTLTGLQVPIGQTKQPVTGVMIENSPDARPQSGLKDAGVVFEAVAEGGITRFLALFQDSPTVPDYIGPVRSVRPYYLDYLGGFDAAVAHVGGSGEALGQVQSQGIKDLDQFYNSGAYHRIDARYAPHNVYTSIADLLSLQKGKGFTSSYTGIARKGKDTPSATPTAKTIDLIISGYLYNVHYDYDTASNSYLRSEGGKPHTDERSATQLSPKVVAVLVVPQGISADGIHTTYESIGSGKLYLFQDGIVTEGIWEKPDRKSQIRFGDANGAPLPVNPGQTWITLVGTAGSVSYKP